jgi:hypothetical protein
MIMLMKYMHGLHNQQAHQEMADNQQMQATVVILYAKDHA